MDISFNLVWTSVSTSSSCSDDAAACVCVCVCVCVFEGVSERERARARKRRSECVREGVFMWEGAHARDCVCCKQKHRHICKSVPICTQSHERIHPSIHPSMHTFMHTPSARVQHENSKALPPTPDHHQDHALPSARRPYPTGTT